MELAFGRRQADLIQLDVATPTQLMIDRNEEELTAIQIKQLSKQAFQEARQSEDICSELQDEGQGIFLAGRQIQDSFRWKQGRNMAKRKRVISLEGAMVGLDLGSRLIKVKMTKVRKDETIFPGKPGIDFLLPGERILAERTRRFFH